MTIDPVTNRWIRNAADERAARDGCRFDEGRGQFVVDWLQRYCVLYEGERAGQPMMLGDWQFDATMRLYGWVRHSPRWNREVRRFKQASIWIAKKNGKSPTLAAWGLYLLCGDAELGQKVFLGAKDGAQAREIAGKHCIEMLTQSEPLMAECKINQSTMQITHLPTRSILKPLSSANSRTQKSKEGINGSVLIDETHVVDREFIDRISRAGISRSEPLQIEVSTAGDNPAGYGKERFDYATKVESGEFHDEELFTAVYAAPQDLSDEDLAADPVKYGRMANPTMGRIVDADEFVRDYERSRKSLSKFNQFKMYRLNIWSNTSSPWIKASDWRKCQHEFDESTLAGRSCIASLDLSRTRDTTALVLVFPPNPDEDPECIHLMPYFWLPKKTAIDRNHLAPWLQWHADGFVELVDGEVINYGKVEKRIIDLAERFKFEELVFDPRYAEELTQRVAEECAIERVAFAQNWNNFSPPTDEFERRVISGKVQHNGHPVLSWQVGHTHVRRGMLGGKWPCKPGDHSDHRTVDGSVATVMGLARLMLRQPESIVSESCVYVYQGERPNAADQADGTNQTWNPPPWNDDDDF